MASMTDYMEQQLMQESAEVEVEKSDDELSMAILESYLSMSAAFATIENAFECASICAFCESAEIDKPTEAAVIVESFWDSVKNVFETIIDWFRSVIQGLVGLFSSAKLQKLIAKLKTMDSTHQIQLDSNVAMMCYTTEAIFGALEVFKTDIIDNVPTHEQVNEIIEDLEKITNNKNWSKGVISKNASIITTDIANNLKESAEQGGVITVDQLVKTLEEINRLKMPKRGTALLKSLKFDEKKYKGTSEDDDGTEKLDKTLINNIKKASRLLAKAYDKITAGLIKVTDIAFKGESVDTKSDTYKSNLEAAQKAHKEAKKYNDDEDSDNRPKTQTESAVEETPENAETVTESEVPQTTSTDEYFD